MIGISRTIVLHPGALGDVLLAIPALRALRAQTSAGELVLAAQPRIGRLLTKLALVDRHVDFDALGVDSLFSDGPASEKLRRLVDGSRVVSWFGSKDPDFTRRLSTLAADVTVASTIPPTGATVWQHLVSSVASVADPWREPIAVPQSIEAEGLRVLAEVGWTGERPLLMLHPGAGGPAKRWPVTGFAEVAGRIVGALGADVVVHDGPADHDAVAELRGRLSVRTMSLVEPPLENLAGGMRHAALWLGNDSGVSHLAAAVGAPTFLLFAEENLAWRPWARHARVRVVAMGAPSRVDVDVVIADAIDLVQAGESRATRIEVRG